MTINKNFTTKNKRAVEAAAKQAKVDEIQSLKRQLETIFSEKKNTKLIFFKTSPIFHLIRRTIQKHLTLIEDEIANREVRCFCFGQRRIFFPPPQFPANCLVYQLDGDPQDKWRSCSLKLEKQNVYYSNTQNFRIAIHYQIQEFRNSRLQGKETFISDYSGREFPCTQLNVDHVKPMTFKKLLADFIAENQHIKMHEIKYSEKYFEHESIFQSWKKFHQQKAKLRLVSEHENCSDLNKVERM